MIDPDASQRQIFVLAERYDSIDGPWHSHRRAQLIYASKGVLTVQSEMGLWVVPPQRGVWIPPGTAHKISADSEFWLHTLYAEPDVTSLPRHWGVVNIDRLTSALLIEAASFGSQVCVGPQALQQDNVMQVLRDRLPNLSQVPSHLPKPLDARIRRISQALEKNPADNRSLYDWANENGLSERTAGRLFQCETGLTFGKWRQQLRLLLAIQLIGLGKGITAVSIEVGYEDTSAFIKAFKAAFGQTPGKYLKGQKASS